LTGEYAWRKKGTGVLPGDARLIIQPGRTTLASMLQTAGYKTGVVGKWHLGLGEGDLDWNHDIKPGPSEVGFDYSFLLPATGDRVPCVYVENNRVINLDPNDPIKVDYTKKIGSDPTGKENPELLKYNISHGHDMTIVNGISRIGFMSGGNSARWIDEEMADVFVRKSNDFIEQNKAKPFFLYFSTHDIHVPRMPNSRFVGKSGLGGRGDAILQFDWTVGQILDTLDRLNLAGNTIFILSSDNGPVVDDGYNDGAVENLNGHTPSGKLRGGKYSAFEAGTRVPFIVRWPKQIKPGISDALICQIDFLASFASFNNQKISSNEAPDSVNIMDALLGKSKKGREYLIEQAGTLSVLQGNWKYIEPSKGQKYNALTNTETGNDTQEQLYDLSKDFGEKNNLAAQNPKKLEELKAILLKSRK
jgi:arylsulfatase A-like enzyme